LFYYCRVGRRSPRAGLSQSADKGIPHPAPHATPPGTIESEKIPFVINDIPTVHGVVFDF
jgi:hypothetical protein